MPSSGLRSNRADISNLAPGPWDHGRWLMMLHESTRRHVAKGLTLVNQRMVNDASSFAIIASPTEKTQLVINQIVLSQLVTDC